ncbi:hypothetical protein [Actinacidiphila oryziradicis]|uniref:DUF3558 domain-containing protein n=1 Tax=Actinacidiphila oryziradicis TaxID=2571141 RepID=A0A4U0SDU2_9ACTN|nr:hypothetical protein [Actinacidiphila oryziradicis]TKA06347.1 hypothetical protein FCI23_32415 [Actinacidiphila oryziradicis]
MQTPRITAVATMAVVLAATACGAGQGSTHNGTSRPTGVVTVLKVMDASHCPSRRPQPTASNVSGLKDRLEPIAANRLLLCGYGGITSTGRPRPPAQARITSHAVIDRLRTILNGLRPPASGTYNCPNDTGGAVLEIFSAGEQAVEIDEPLTGCQFVTNGQRTGQAADSALRTTVLSLLSPQAGLS